MSPISRAGFFKYFELTELAGTDSTSPADDGEPETLSPIHKLGLKIKAPPTSDHRLHQRLRHRRRDGGLAELPFPADGYGRSRLNLAIAADHLRHRALRRGVMSYVRMLRISLALDLLLHGELMPPERALALGLSAGPCWPGRAGCRACFERRSRLSPRFMPRRRA
jgi:hypothetical protein